MAVHCTIHRFYLSTGEKGTQVTLGWWFMSCPCTCSSNDDWKVCPIGQVLNCQWLVLRCCSARNWKRKHCFSHGPNRKDDGKRWNSAGSWCSFALGEDGGGWLAEHVGAVLPLSASSWPMLGRCWVMWGYVGPTLRPYWWWVSWRWWHGMRALI